MLSPVLHDVSHNITRSAYLQILPIKTTLVGGNLFLYASFFSGIQPEVLGYNCGTDLQLLMTDTLLHRSLPNLSKFSRTVWMPQFTTKPMAWKETGSLVSMAVPF